MNEIENFEKAILLAKKMHSSMLEDFPETLDREMIAIIFGAVSLFFKKLLESAIEDTKTRIEFFNMISNGFLNDWKKANE